MVSAISEDLGAAQAQLDRARRRRDVAHELESLARPWILLRDREEAKAELRSVAVTPRVFQPATIASPVVASGGHPLLEADRIVTERAFYARQVERARGISWKRDTADDLVEKVVRVDAALEAWNDAQPRLARARSQSGATTDPLMWDLQAKAFDRAYAADVVERARTGRTRISAQGFRGRTAEIRARDLARARPDAPEATSADPLMGRRAVVRRTRVALAPCVIMSANLSTDASAREYVGSVGDAIAYALRGA